MELPNRSRIVLRAVSALLLLALVAYAAHAGFRFGGSSLDGLFNDWIYNGLLVGGAGLCLARGVLVAEERPAWLILGFGLAAWAAGDIHWTLALSGLESPPFPSLSDAFYLALYPAAYVALVLLLRARVSGFWRSLWLDGAIGALAVASIAAAVAFTPIIEATEGDAAAVATNLAYPLGDLLLLALVVVVFGLSGWRPGRAWVLIGAGLGLMSVADVIFLFQAATDSYVEGTLLDALWPAAVVLTGLAAWHAPQRSEEAEIRGWLVVLVPSVCGVSALTLLVFDHFERMNDPALVLSTATVLAVTVRMAVSFVENLRMLARSRREALTDALTGLGNRRKLMRDLEEQLVPSADGEGRVLALFDLDGFKQYNDSFGHVAGDELLGRLGRQLAESVRPFGCAYRLGGDEFCALVQIAPPGTDSIVAGAAAALSERGEGFSIGSSFGTATLPSETTDPSSALLLADRRMYAQKGGRRASATRQAHDVLLTALRERQPDLHEHLHDMAELALQMGRRLGMSPEALDELARAAELHDVGKVAIPDAILNKPGPLDPNEWSFMRRHTIIGERILDSAPALRPVAALVRSSHERHDGSGYPDGLAGDGIPLGARIVAVCDAYQAMTSERPYSAAMSHEDAVQELRSCAGSQFDPRVVEAFCLEVEAADWAGQTRDPAAG
jgi:two-component system, cell cycle response regulator